MKPTRQERALAACVEYDTLLTHIADLTQNIGNALGQCPIAVNADADSDQINPTHLNEALGPYTEDDGCGCPRTVYLTDEEKRPILDQCSHCSIAYDYIQQRRAAKKRLGAVKRSIRFIGRTHA